MFPLLVVALLLVAGPDSKSVVLTGVVSDESCGAAHLKAGDEQCVVKCLRGGASVGHPEWKPQRMVLVARDGSSTLFIANPERLKDHAGQEVTVRATAPGKTKTVRVLALLTK
jgi:hypothetical protein